MCFLNQKFSKPMNKYGWKFYEKLHKYVEWLKEKMIRKVSIHKQHMLTNPLHKCTAGTQVIFAIHIQHPNHLYNKLITSPLQTLHEGVGIGRNNLSCIIDSKSNVQDSEKTPSKLMRCLYDIEKKYQSRNLKHNSVIEPLLCTFKDQDIWVFQLNSFWSWCCYCWCWKTKQNKKK